MFKWIISFSLLGFNVLAVEGQVDTEILEAGAPLADSRNELLKFLNAMTLSNNGLYNKILSPAKSLNLNLSESDRTLEINNKVAGEIDAVLTTFKNSREENKLQAVRAQVSKFDPEVVSNNGAHIIFFNNGPSAAFSRVLMMIEKKAENAAVTADAILKSFSSYKRSAIPSTYVYEYSDAANISQSTIKTGVGSDATWKLPLAAEAIKPNQDIVLKKCRQIFGWKCVTSLYRTSQILQGNDSIKILYAGIYNLVSNPDHPEFSGDKRSTNQITGSTAFYTVRESSNWVILYGIDAQWNQGTILFTPLISEEFLKDSRRIKERLSLDLNVPTSDIK